MIPSLRLALLMASALCLAACSSRPAHEPALYVLRTPAAESRPASADAPRLRLARIELASHIRGLSFVAVDGRVTTLVYTRFAAPLGESIEEAALDRLRAAGRWSTVVPAAHPGRADTTLRLVVRRFEIDASGSDYVAVVGLDVTLDGPDGRETLRSFRIEETRTPEGSGDPALIRALETALAAALDAVVASL